MQNWEYMSIIGELNGKVFQVNAQRVKEMRNFHDFTNHLGSQGWESVGYFVTGATYSCNMIFKCPKP